MPQIYDILNILICDKLRWLCLWTYEFLKTCTQMEVAQKNISKCCSTIRAEIKLTSEKSNVWRCATTQWSDSNDKWYDKRASKEKAQETNIKSRIKRKIPWFLSYLAIFPAFPAYIFQQENFPSSPFVPTTVHSTSQDGNLKFFITHPEWA